MKDRPEALNRILGSGPGGSETNLGTTTDILPLRTRYFELPLT